MNPKDYKVNTAKWHLAQLLSEIKPECKLHKDTVLNLIDMSFNEGVEYTNRWISVNDELPKYNGKTYSLLLKDKNGMYILHKVLSYEHTWLDVIFGKGITHWRYID